MLSVYKIKGENNMSTRSLLLIKSNNQYKVEQYQHHDGYPEGKGILILSWMKLDDNLNNLMSAFSCI